MSEAYRSARSHTWRYPCSVGSTRAKIRACQGAGMPSSASGAAGTPVGDVIARVAR